LICKVDGKNANARRISVLITDDHKEVLCVFFLPALEAKVTINGIPESEDREKRGSI